MENKLESRTNKLEVQPKNNPDDEFLGNLNEAISGAVKKPIDQDNDKSSIDEEDVAGAQQPSNAKLDDQEYEQIYSRLQERVDTAINALADVNTDLEYLLASDISHAFANSEQIHTSYNSNHRGITTDSYNAVTKAISDLKFNFKSKSLW